MRTLHYTLKFKSRSVQPQYVSVTIEKLHWSNGSEGHHKCLYKDGFWNSEVLMTNLDAKTTYLNQKQPGSTYTDM